MSICSQRWLSSAKVETPDNLQGQSLVPMLRDASATGRGWALTQVMRGGGQNRASVSTNVGAAGARFFGYSLRTPRWRYTEWDGGKRGRELYDHDADPKELTNLAEKPDFKQVVDELSAQLAKATPKTFPANGQTPEVSNALWAPNLTNP